MVYYFLCLFCVLLTPVFADPIQNIFVIVNPISGGVNKVKLLDEFLNQIDGEQFSVEVRFTEGPHHATKLAEEALAEGVNIIVAIGGDGTVNEIAQVLVSTEVALALIPTGSGNGLARHLEIPLNVSGAVDVINGGKIRAIDSVKINDQFYFGVAGIGFDAQISWDFAEYGRRGFLSYAILTLKNIPYYQSKIYELSVDGRKLSREAFGISFANGSEFGNGAAIAPKAKIDDGFLDVVILNKFPLYAGAGIAWRLFNQTLHKSKYIEQFRCKEVEIKEKNLKAHIDGEPVLFPDGLHLQIVPSSLKVLVPFNTSRNK